MKLSTWQPSLAPSRWPVLCLAIFVVTFLMSAIVPSFQAPDEFDHVNRAYMLSQGQWVLHSVDGSPSGGTVDQGLVDYGSHFIPLKGHADRQLSADERDRAASTEWTGRPTFVTAVGTAYYFPALYMPQAIGLAAGKIAGLRVGQSYRLARYLTLACCFALLIAAFRIFPPPTFVLALLALPMNLFLLSSAVLDGMATCTAILALSCFMRLLRARENTSPYLILSLAMSVGLVAACRANLLPLLALPFAAWWLRRNRLAMWCALVTAVLVLAWTLFTLTSTVYPPGPRNIDHGARLVGYLTHPWTFGRIVFSTLTDWPTFHFYVFSFIGILGWLDASFSPVVYYLMAALLAAIGLLSLSMRNVDDDRMMRALLVGCAVAAVLLTFLALLVQWTVGPATTVDGIQGRYFMIPAVIVTYALLGHVEPRSGVTETCRFGLTILLLAVSTYATALLLVSRYYTPPTQPAKEQTSIIAPSEPLTRDRPIALHFSEEQMANPSPLDRIAIRLGTYMSSHPGKATLVLRTNGGATLHQTFELSSVADNAYQTFELDGKPYIGGEIVSDGGEGISTYQVRTGETKLVDCMQTHATNGSERVPASCPTP